MTFCVSFSDKFSISTENHILNNTLFVHTFIHLVALYRQKYFELEHEKRYLIAYVNNQNSESSCPLHQLKACVS